MQTILDDDYKVIKKALADRLDTDPPVPFDLSCDEGQASRNKERDTIVPASREKGIDADTEASVGEKQ